MDTSRRKFLKMAGATALVSVAIPAGFQLTPADVFASEAPKEHGAGHGVAETPVGVRLGMVIDMRKLYDNPELLDKAINACNSVHNVPDFRLENGEIDTQHEIKWIFKVPFENAFIDHSNYHMSEVIEENDFLVLCNHCDEPPCVRVCPTKATFKDEINGVVSMDYHRCIGCRFCMVACPYGARSFNWSDPRPHIKEYNRAFATRTRGVVEKCNFCSERLALGQDPACVEALKDVGAIVWGDLNDAHSELRQVLKDNPTIQRNPALGTKPSVFYIV